MTITEFAAKHGKSVAATRYMIKRGKLTATKANGWQLEDQPWPEPGIRGRRWPKKEKP